MIEKNEILQNLSLIDKNPKISDFLTKHEKEIQKKLSVELRGQGGADDELMLKIYVKF